MNLVTTTQPLQISEIRDVRRVELTPKRFVTVADVLLIGALLPISVDVNSLTAVELASSLDVDLSAESREIERDATFGGQNMSANLEPVNNTELRQSANWDFSPIPSDMPIIDFDDIKEIPF